MILNVKKVRSMRKWLIVEIIILVLLLGFAAAVCFGIPAGLFPPGDAQPTETKATGETTGVATAATTQETTEATTEATTAATTEATTVATEPFEMPQITWRTLPEDRELTATQAFVYDCQSESYTYLMGEPEDRVWPASITKLFSMYVAQQYLDPTWELVAGSILDRIPEDASTAKLEAGDICTVEMLLEAMLLPSGNDAAYMIATEAGREIAGNPDLGIDEALAAFVEEMNRQAQELGMTGTRFVNPDGYHHEEHYTNFNDLVTVAKLSLENETVMRYSTVPKETAQPVFGHPKEWINTNLLVNPETIYYCPYAIGLKTGQTDAAGSCLLAAFDVEGRQYIVGVFGSTSFDDKLDDTLQIFNTHVIEAG